MARPGTGNSGVFPKTACAIRVAATEEKTSGAKTSSAKLPKMISVVNRAAPMGAL